MYFEFRSVGLETQPGATTEHLEDKGRNGGQSTGIFSAPFRLLELQHEHLDDHALLDMMLLRVIRRARQRQLVVNKLISQFGCFADCISASYEDLRSIDGLDDLGIAALKVAQAAAVRLAKAKIMHRPIMRNRLALMEYLTILLAREPTEHLRALYLDAKNRVMSDDRLAHGTVNAVQFDLRTLVGQALKVNATAVILVHNHPSGDPTPSREDVDLTRRISAALATISVIVHDHVIVGKGRCVSLRQEALI